MPDLRMPDINSIHLCARLTRDPETRNLPSGTAVCNLGVVYSRKFKKQGQTEYSEETTFIDVECWDKTAERAAELHKGDPVHIEGSLKMDAWEDDSGQKRTKLKIRAHRIQPMAWVGTKTAAPAAAAPDNEDDIPF